MKPQAYPSLDSIVEYRDGVRESVYGYFSMLKSGKVISSNPLLYLGATPAEVDKIRDELLAEEDRRTRFALLTYIEATFKAHFLYIVDYKKKSPLLKPFKRLHYHNGKLASNVSLERHILKEWRKCGRISDEFYIKLVGALHFRHWFAHGRFLELTPSPRGISLYDYSELYMLAQTSRNLCSEAEPYLS